MKWKHFLSGVLVAVMIFTSVPAVKVSAETKVEEGLVASYDFDEETLENLVKQGDQATAVVTGLSSYTGKVTYADGRNGTKAVSLGDYGLKLNQMNLGDSYTVSMWMQAKGSIANNQSVLFLGYHDPEVWYALAGSSTSNNLIKAWAKGNGYNWTEFDTFQIKNDWHFVTITDDGETTKIYVDGSVAVTNDTNKPLSGENQDIYVGVTYWDPEFTGLVDDIKVYNRALTTAEVQRLDSDIYEAAEKEFKNAWKEVSLTDILGANESAESIQFNLDLFDEAAGGTVTWTSSKPDVITVDGTVQAPEQKTKVTMTATVTCGAFSDSKSIDLTVLPLDKASLEDLIARAEALDVSKYRDTSVELLNQVLEAAKQVHNQNVIEIAKSEIYYALSQMQYKDEYQTPFPYISKHHSYKPIAMHVGEETIAFDLPDGVLEDYVSVEYYSSDESVVAYKDGKVTAVGEGKASVTAVVTSKFNGHKDDYFNVVTVSDDTALSVTTDTVNQAEDKENEDVNITDPTDGPLYIKESSIHQLLTEDFELPTSISGKSVDIFYYLEDEGSDYVTLEDNVLKVTRPYGGEGNYTFVVCADIYEGDEVVTQRFPFTIAEGITEDTYAGYVYVCFGNQNGSDVQQVHFFLSEDGLNWTAVNGFNPVFEVGTDYADLINNAGTHNYTIATGADISETVSGDASVLFPFEGDDQGIRDPYIIRGAREEDSDKIWILATDLNTMSSQYGGNLSSNKVGNWGTMSSQGSTSIFVYETEDWVHWERRYIDVGTEVNAGAAWAPEAVYNPEKDNYLVYWSCRVSTDGNARNRLYCNETEDFITFSETKLYEQEDFYKEWGKLVNSNDGYGNIDTSQLWVADEDGNPYGTLYRLVKDETDNHIQLMSAETVLDPHVDYDETNPNRITPYTFNGKEYATKSDLSGLNDYEKAEVVWNWFKAESTGDHFEYISQKNMEAKSGAYEGATMFKFNDRDEWCIMIDYYGNNSVRYEPYTTTDLSKEDSITKVTSGYGRTGGDVGCHGGMIPITVAEYNTIIDTYNSDPDVDNYHEIDYIEIDKRPYEALLSRIEEKLNEEDLSKEVQSILSDSCIKLEGMIQQAMVDQNIADGIESQVKFLLGENSAISLKEKHITMSKGETKKVVLEGEPSWYSWYSYDKSVVNVKEGVISAVDEGTTYVVVREDTEALELIKVTVTSGDIIYEDVTAGDWFYDAVANNYYAGTMTGIDPKHFGPYDTISRAQFALILYRMEGEPDYAASKTFKDIAGDEWYADAVLWAASVGVISGYEDGYFGPADLITREQMAVMIYRYGVEYLHMDHYVEDINSYTDASSVSPFALDGVKWTVGNGIITGKDNGTKLDPQGNTTRCEAAVIIQRFMSK